MEWWAPYIGTPFAECHCWGLVRRVYRDMLHVDLPEYGEISARDLVKIAREIRTACDTTWERVFDPRPFDVVTMRARKTVVHVGVVTRPGWLLHTEEACDAVTVPMDHISVRGRIVGYWRLR